MTENAPATDPHYVLIQRINNPSLAVMYPDLDTATAALNEDQFITNICAEDAIDAVVSDDATGYTIVPRSSVVETRTVDPMGPIEDIIDAEVVEDEQADEDDENAVRAAVFFSHPYAPTLFLTKTVLRLISSARIERGVVDLSGAPGLAIAEAFVQAGVPFEDLQYGQLTHYVSLSEDGELVADDEMAARAARVKSLAAEVHEVPMEDLYKVPASIVIVPAPVETGSRIVYFGPDAMPGIIVAQLGLADEEMPMIMIDTPERGLQAYGPDDYERVLTHIEPKD